MNLGLPGPGGETSAAALPILPARYEATSRTALELVTETGVSSFGPRPPRSRHRKWGGLPAAPLLKSRLTEPQALADLALAQRRDDHVAEEREAAIGVWMRPVLGRDRLPKELSGRRIEGVVEA